VDTRAAATVGRTAAAPDCYDGLGRRGRLLVRHQPLQVLQAASHALRTARFGALALPANPAVDASTNPTVGQVWLKRIERYLIYERDNSLRFVWPSADAVFYEMVTQYGYFSPGGTMMSKAMQDGLRGNMRRYMDHVRAARSFPVWIIE
jgi:hypothetical protein